MFVLSCVIIPFTSYTILQNKQLHSTNTCLSTSLTDAPVAVTMMADEQPVSEGHSVNLECVADSNPQPGRYVWIRRQGGQSIQTNSTQGNMSYANISRDSSFSCIVQNNIGSNQSAWLFLDVNCKYLIVCVYCLVAQFPMELALYLYTEMLILATGYGCKIEEQTPSHPNVVLLSLFLTYNKKENIIFFKSPLCVILSLQSPQQSSLTPLALWRVGF